MGSQAKWLRCQQKQPKICLLRYLHDNMHKRDRWSKKTIAFPAADVEMYGQAMKLCLRHFFRSTVCTTLQKGILWLLQIVRKIRAHGKMYERTALCFRELRLSNSERTIMRAAHCFQKAFDINLHLIESCYWSVSCT